MAHETLRGGVRATISRNTLVPRRRLVRLLDQYVATPGVTLVTGPAGSGKTTLIKAWAKRLSARAGPVEAPHLGWVNLDASHDNPSLLWSAMLAACADGRSVRAGQVNGHRTPGGEAKATAAASLSAIVSAVAEPYAPVCLVLDDLQVLQDPRTLRSLEMLLRRLPRQLRLILAGRDVPALCLPRLRLEGRLREIGARQLAFTREEANSLLSHHGIHLDEPDLSALMDRTEGWAAGLRLAALCLEGAEDPGAVIGALAEDERTVADYLASEVLSGVPRRVRRFLLETSVCDELTADLAAALSEQEDAGRILQDLVRANVLAEQRNGGWHRYHPMLRDYLRAELRRRGPATTSQLHSIACTWFEEHDAPIPALAHAIAVRDAEKITRLVSTSGPELIMTGDGGTLRRLLDSVDRDLGEHPAVALMSVACAVDAGDLAVADARMAALRWQPAEHAEHRLRAVHGALALDGATQESLPTALSVLEDTGALDVHDPDIQLFVLTKRADAFLWAGRYEEAEVDLRRAMDLARSSHRDYVALHCMSRLAASAGGRGDLVEMSRQLGATLNFARHRGWPRSPSCGHAYILASWLAYQTLDEEAVRYVSLARKALADRADPRAEFMIRTMASAIFFDRVDDKHGLVADLRSDRRRLGGDRLPSLLCAMSLPLEQFLAFRVGESAWAAEVANLGQRLLGERAEAHLLRAVMHARTGRTEQAEGALQLILQDELPGFPATLLDAWLLQTSLAARGGDSRGAYRALRKALDLAAPARLVRPFINADEPARDLLVAGLGRFGRQDGFARDVVAALRRLASHSIGVLTEREYAVLEELPSLHTIEEISETLVLSVNTVKTHLRTIYQKLGVHTRREAVDAARRSGLL